MRTFQHSILIAATALFICPSTYAQNTFWGMTSDGGPNNVGVIYTMNESGTYTQQHAFDQFKGAGPQCNIVKAAGKYYGVTEFGGDNGLGTIFSYDPTSSTYTSLYSMTNTSGTQPIRGFVLASNNRLYGTCSAGGANSFGTVIEYNPSTNAFLKKFDMTSTGGRNPRGAMVLAANGKLYGTTLQGGSGIPAGGVIYEYTPPNTYVKKIDLNLTTGSNPVAGMIRASNNLLYGVTQNGGASNVGVIFSYNTTTNVQTVLHSFNTTDGKNPQGELVQANNGLLYGTTQSGGATNQGVIFSYNLTTNVFTKLVDLDPTLGYAPVGRLIKGANGLLYGTTLLGGTLSAGTIFSFNTTTNTYSKLYDMSDGGYSSARSGLTEDAAGTFIGVTQDGGSGGSGALYQFLASNNSTAELVPFSFSTGGTPKGRLVLDGNGKFYGLTSRGGTNDEGSLFSYDPNTNTHTPLASFGGVTGSFPLGTLIPFNGKYYALCNAGGTFGGGTLFEYTVAGNTLVKKLDLTAATGTLPLSSLVAASNGKLYGMTSSGGTNGEGTLFDYVPSTNTLTVRMALSVANGTQPLADLTQASNGLLYGVLSEDGSFANGVLFSFNTASNVFTKLWEFDALQGGAPAGKVFQASNGKLYGMCKEEGLFFQGCIYSWDIGTATYTQEYDMTAAEGAFSESSLIEGVDTKLYGSCTQGGTSGTGSIFRWNPTNGVYEVLRSLSAADGITPFDGMIVGSTLGGSTVSLALKVFLNGPYASGSGLMNDALRSLGTFPLTEPYTGLGFVHVGGGGETISPTVLTATGDNAIVDWCFVELRNKNDNTVIVRTSSALLQRDGDVVDLDGVTALSIPVAADDYYVAIRHRNHLGAMRSTTVALSAATTNVDFTNGSSPLFGTDPVINVSGVRQLWTGNSRVDNVVKYAGSLNDRDAILTRIGGSIPTAVVNGYWIEDVNMDGLVKYAGSGNDRDRVLTTIGGSVPTATRVQQLP